MSAYIPWDLISDIFSRLQIKCIFKYACKSRKIYDLIRSSYFNKIHVKFHYKDSSDLLIVRRFLREPGSNQLQEIYTLYRDTGIVCTRIKDLVLPTTEREKCLVYLIIGNSNGLVCFSDDYDRLHTYAITLWNPMSNKFLELPRLEVTYGSSKGFFQYVLGFGFEAQTGDYKILKEVDYRDYIDDPELEVYIFSVNTRRWRNITSSIFELPYVMTGNPKSVLYNGHIHWVLSTFFSQEKHLVAFDLYEEDFKYVGLPSKFPLRALSGNLEYGSDCFDIGVINDSFCAVECYTTRYIIWRMKKYGLVTSWEKILSVDYPRVIEKFVGFGKNGNPIIGIGQRLYVFDPQTLVLRELGIDYPYNLFSSLFYIGSYVESLGLYIG